ncbi:dipeptidyl aminopeptidase [Nakamurella flava]|uniref:Dipeptidyl aminopeptidase n=1 Tax=Nakamurella flava TaxID=2576308 RepID=A0A4U6QAZ6_9ACTN|nr:prolyl oligopeptidase family serine peptidase [Nakamurella flava]TKV57069.1 dipeptidyl aminopeptidase [Nakamurella flava]
MGTDRFFAADDFDFAARLIVGHSGQGVIDPGIVLRTLAAIEDDDATGWYTQWNAVADRLAGQAAERQAAGRPSAGRLWLNASAAYDAALAFVDGMPDDSVLRPTFRRHRDAWDAFIAASGGAHVRFDVPWGEHRLPGYLLRPAADGAPRPTLVVTNGSDGALTSLWSACLRMALDQGWNAYVFDGPGQQSMLFEQGVPFVPDWESVLTPVVDALVARPDVDADRLLAYGISQGGYWLPRALAFEHRFRAAVADGGVVDVSRTWNAHLPPVMLDLLRSGDAETFDRYMAEPADDPRTERELAFRARPYGADLTPFALFTQVDRFVLDPATIARIDTPLLITDPAGEQFFPGQSRELYEALPGEKQLIAYGEQDGASWHCEPMARGLVALDMADFLHGHLG